MPMKILFPFKNHMHTIVLCQRFNRTIPLALYKKYCYRLLGFSVVLVINRVWFLHSSFELAMFF